MTENKYCGKCGSEKPKYKYGSMEWLGDCEVCGHEESDVPEADVKEYVDCLNKLRDVLASRNSMKDLEEQGITLDTIKSMVALVEKSLVDVPIGGK